MIELLVVIAIISLLVSILLPSLSRAKELAKVTICLSNLRNIGLSMATYLHEHDGVYPPYNAGGSSPSSQWHGQMTNAGCLPDHQIVFCPNFKPHPLGLDYHFRIGRIGYGINLALTYNFETTDGDDVANVGELARPAETIVLVDAWQLAVDIHGIPQNSIETL